MCELMHCLGMQDGRSPYFGAVVGRVANRIADAEFVLEGTTHKLAANNPPNALHGGKRGFDKVVWDGDRIVHPEGDAVRLQYISRSGEEVRRCPASVQQRCMPPGCERSCIAEVQAIRM